MAVNVTGHAPFRQFRTKDLRFFGFDRDQSAGDDFANGATRTPFCSIATLEPSACGTGSR
jgi:hypothetical protein